MRANAGIYTPSGLDGYQLCHPVNQSDFERINLEINGTPRQTDWKPMPMRLVHDDQGQQLVASDSPWLGSHALMFVPRAVEALGSTLRDYGELLPLVCPGADVVMCNPTHMIDALDEAASSVRRFSGGRVMRIQRHVFRADVIGDIDIFKIPNLRVSPTFLSQRFVDRWKASGLKGLDFKHVWAPAD